MLFNTYEFAVFFVLVFGLYYFFRKKYRAQNWILLIASYVFYGWWDIRFLFLIVLSTAIDYMSGLMIDVGTVSLKQRIKTGLFVFFSAFFFLFFQYSAVSFSGFSLSIDWKNLIHPFGGYTLLITILAIAIFNIFYYFTKDISENKKRKIFIFLSIFSNLAILGFFKYFNFFMDSFADLSQMLFNIKPSLWTLKVILPVGISFYTFQTMSYSIDIYRGKLKSSDKLLEFATYVAFFPQLVAGPIERAKHLLPQFFSPRTIARGNDLKDSLWLIFWGLFKKVVIADNMATLVNQVFGPYDGLHPSMVVPEDGLRMLIGLYAFAFQIYGDFSGYTDIARGTARIFGFDILRNFNLPYFATCPSNFWRRWHISLSSWLGDYLYIPLGGNRKGKWSTYKNLGLTMLLGGLWHGASWTFVIWGGYQGGLLIAYRMLGIRTDGKDYKWWKKFILAFIMFHFTCIGWLIFRAQNLTTIKIFLKSIFLSPFGSAEAFANLKTVLFYIWFLLLFQVIQAVKKELEPVKNWHWFIQLNIWIFVLMSLVTLANPEVQEFIYFAF